MSGSRGQPLSAPPGVAGPTRRGFLKLAGSAAAFAALSRLPAVPAHATARAAASGARFFSAEEREILTQIAERMVASDDARAPSVRNTRAIETIDALCASLDPQVSEPLPSALWLFEYGPLVFDFTFTRFTRMSPAQKDASLSAWMNSRLALRRRAFYALRNLAFLGYYAQPEVWPAIGYAGPLLHREAGAP